MATAIHIELNALCLLLLSVIAYQSVHNVNQQMKRVLFRNLLYGVSIALILDTVWLLVDGHQFPGGVFINRLVNALYLGTSVVLGCLWFLYVLETLGHNLTHRLHIIVMIPGGIFILLNLMSIWTEWIFYVTEDNVYVRGTHFWLQNIGAYGMLLISLIYIIMHLFKHDIAVPRHSIYKLLGFYIVPVIGSLASIPYTGMPGAWTCASISLVLMYIDDQDHEILRDGLTGLNNRKVLENSFSEYAKSGDGLSLLMIDLDNFKHINDTLGHPVGDEALVAAAKILTRSMGGVRGIVCRYGGDEFLILGFFKGAEYEFKNNLQERFRIYNEENELPYRLEASIGIGHFESGMTLDALLKSADTDLYVDKKSRNAGRYYPHFL